MIELYDERKNLVSLSNSILNYYGIKKYHNSLETLDNEFNKNKNKKICLILLDGFGKYIQELYNEYCPFIFKHKKEEITSIFPPTTVAATTALLSGKYPIETGWLGWTEQIKNYPLPVYMFYSLMIDDSKIDKSTYEIYPYESIIESINKKGYKADKLQSFLYDDSIEDYFYRAQKVIDNNDFSYIYHVQPDEALHLNGVGSTKLNLIIKKLDDAIEKLVKNNPEVLFILIADHGHKNIKYCYIEEHDDFYSLLDVKYYSLESRAASFVVKKDKLDEFYLLAKKYYDDKFYIFSKDEVKKNKIFGISDDTSKIDEIIGDFLFISKGDYGFNFKDNVELVSQHAGSTLEERILNLALFNFLN